MKKKPKRVEEERFFWKIEKRKVSEIKDFRKNPRSIGKKNYELIRESIQKYGLIDRPFINQDGTLIGGHVRARILQELGLDEIEVFVSPRMLNEKEMQELCIKHNKLSGEWDVDMLANEYEFSDLMLWGFEEKELTGETANKKRKTKPKFVIEFSNIDDLTEFSENHGTVIRDFVKEKKAIIKLMGLEDG